MIKIKHEFLYIALVVFAVGFAFWMASGTSRTFGGTSAAGSQADSCVSSSSLVTIQSTGPTQIMSSSSNRAYAHIQQPLNATNTVHLLMAQGAPITATGASFTLENASTTLGLTGVEFGLATNFPYTGAVSASSSIGGTVLRVTQCLY